MMWFANVNSLDEDIISCVSLDVLMDANVDTLYGEILDVLVGCSSGC